MGKIIKITIAGNKASYSVVEKSSLKEVYEELIDSWNKNFVNDTGLEERSSRYNSDTTCYGDNSFEFWSISIYEDSERVDSYVSVVSNSEFIIPVRWEVDDESYWSVAFSWGDVSVDLNMDIFIEEKNFERFIKRNGIYFGFDAEIDSEFKCLWPYGNPLETFFEITIKNISAHPYDIFDSTDPAVWTKTVVNEDGNMILEFEYSYTMEELLKNGNDILKDTK